MCPALLSQAAPSQISQDARKVVGVWEAEFARAPSAQKKMALLYLANDILQNSRKKGPEYVHEFFRALPRPLQQLLKHGDDKARPPAPLGLCFAFRAFITSLLLRNWPPTFLHWLKFPACDQDPGLLVAKQVQAAAVNKE